VQEVRANGHEALMLATALLQRVRLADPGAGLWEAADAGAAGYRLTGRSCFE
jgi:hypothetical protein